MSQGFSFIMAVGLIGLAAACTRPAENEFVVVEPASAAPEQTGEY
ncbi:hypothetical protein AAFO92_13245 [Roseovarius sp. CAU 1744]